MGHRIYHDRVIELLLKGYTSSEIWKVLGCSYKTAYFVARRVGFPIQGRGDRGGMGKTYFDWRLRVRVWQQEQERLKQLEKIGAL